MLITKSNSQSYIDSNAGFGMVEVLVAALLLAIGVLGFSAMQTRSLQSSNEAMSRTRALTIARDLSERIRNNSVSDAVIVNYFDAMTGSDADPKTATEKNCTNGCSPADLAFNDAIHIRKAALDDDLSVRLATCPGASGAKLTAGTAPTSTLGSTCVIIAWGETEPEIGSVSPKCIKATGQYLKDSRCVVMEVL